jgi:hypothetical protein
MIWAAQRFQPLPQGLLLRLHPRAEPVSLGSLLRRNELLWEQIRFPDLGAVRLEEDLSPDYVPNHYACMLVNFGGLYEASGDQEKARALYGQAAEWAPGFADARDALRSLGPEPRSSRAPVNGRPRAAERGPHG